MHGLNYNHLYYFWVTAEAGSVTAAGRRLNLTPQTISGQLRTLEQAIGGRLFRREGRGLSLTDSGRLVFQYADEMFRLGAEMQGVLAGGAAGAARRFTVGIVDVVPKMIAYRLIEPALQLPEPVQLICREGKLDDLLADIAAHKLDMVLADTPMGGAANIKAFNHLLGECGIGFFAAPALAERYRPGFPHSLQDAPLLAPAPGAALRGALNQWLDRLEIQPRIAGEFEDSALMKAFGQAGVGIFLAPLVIEQEVIRQFDVRPLGRSDEIRERFYAISAERRLRHPAVVAVSQAARDAVFC